MIFAQQPGALGEFFPSRSLSHRARGAQEVSPLIYGGAAKLDN